MEINLWGVLLAALVGMVVGGLWYSPILFGDKWVALMGWSKEEQEKMKKKAGPSYVLGFLVQFVTAYVLAHVLNAFDVITISSAIQTAFWAWLGFVATTQIGSVLWEGKSTKLWILNTAYSFISLCVMAMVLVAWNGSIIK